MITTGHMVRHAGGPPMLVRHIFRDMAHCQFVDQHGRIRNYFALLRDLAPLWRSIGPKTLWPEPDRLIVTEDELGAIERRRRVIPPDRGKTTKPRRSNKLKRKSGMSAIDKVLFEIEEWREGKLWGAPRIAEFCGVSVDTVARWADDPQCPVRKIGGRYFVMRTVLMAWMTSKNAA